jgi:hypothetical protein
MHPKATIKEESTIRNEVLSSLPFRILAIRQVVHRLMDSHVTGYVRYKPAVVEINPTIGPYGKGV